MKEVSDRSPDRRGVCPKGICFKIKHINQFQRRLAKVNPTEHSIKPAMMSKNLDENCTKKK